MVAASGHEDPALRLQRRADRICSLIVGSDVPDDLIETEIGHLRQWCQANLPERLELFDLVYGGRFARLRQQFRSF